MSNNYAFHTDFISIFTREGILWCQYKEKAIITIDKARIIVEERLKVAGNTSYPTIADCRELKTIDKNSRSYFGKEDATKCVTAGAILFKSPVQSMLASTYLWFDNPKVPTAVFSDEHKAINWLKLFIINKN